MSTDPRFKVAYLWIPRKLPSMNDIVKAAKSRGNGTAYATLKREAETRVELSIMAAALPAFGGEVCLTYSLVEPDTRRDPGNVLAGAMKFVEDALVRTLVLTGDGWAGIASYGPTTWRTSAYGDGVEVKLEGIEKCQRR